MTSHSHSNLFLSQYKPQPLSQCFFLFFSVLHFVTLELSNTYKFPLGGNFLLYFTLISSFNCDRFVTSIDSHINTLLTHKFSYPTHLSLYSICVDITHSYDLPVHCFDNDYHIQIIAIHKLGDNYLCFLKLISTVWLHPSITDGDVPF